jgi:endonuclease-3
MLDLRTRGFATVFQQLVACIISIRTRDEVSLPAAVRLLEAAPDATSMSRMSEREIDRLSDVSLASR